MLRTGIIGLGVGEGHLVSYQGIKGVEVAAICDRDEKRLAKIGNQYSVERRHTDYRDVTEDPDIDIISICSYDDWHAEQAVSALNHGKHVMIEKPIALYPRDAERILRAKEDSGKFITSNLILRQSPRLREVKRMIDAGEFGDIFCIEGDYIHEILWKITEGWRGKMDFYCTVYGGGIHLIDLMRWLLSEEIVEVSGMGTDLLTRQSRYPRDDTFINLFKFEGGALGKCLTTFGPQRTKFHALNIYGTRRTFINDMPNAKMFHGTEQNDEAVVTTPYPGMKKGDLLPEFVEAIRANREPTVGARDVFRVMDVCFAAWESARSGHRVKVRYLI